MYYAKKKQNVVVCLIDFILLKLFHSKLSSIMKTNIYQAIFKLIITPKILSLLIVIIFSISIVSAQKGIHVETLDLQSTDDSSVKIDFGNTPSSIFTYGLHIEGTPLNTSQKGATLGIIANTYSDYSSQKGAAFGRMATSKPFTGDASFIGIGGYVEATALSNSNSLYTKLIGGDFSVRPETNVSLNGPKHFVAGVRSVLEGTINNTPSDGAIAAIVGIDYSQGTGQSWAAYLEGKSYLSDKAAIGTKVIPSSAGGFDVSNFNLIVTGGILTEECLVVTQDNWADYVFNANYQLLPLEKVEKFISKNGHLPNIPSGEVMDKNGIPLAKMTILQQEKIEELFLHSIELSKENKALKEENTALLKRLELIEKRLATLEN